MRRINIRDKILRIKIIQWTLQQKINLFNFNRKVLILKINYCKGKITLSITQEMEMVILYLKIKYRALIKKDLNKVEDSRNKKLKILIIFKFKIIKIAMTKMSLRMKKKTFLTQMTKTLSIKIYKKKTQVAMAMMMTTMTITMKILPKMSTNPLKRLTSNLS